jgi:hypothetical protein
MTNDNLDNLEKFRVALTQFELKMTKSLNKLKKDMFVSPIRARKQIEELRQKYLLQENTILMFRRLGMLQEYTNLLNSYNRVLDGDLT